MSVGRSFREEHFGNHFVLVIFSSQQVWSFGLPLQDPGILALRPEGHKRSFEMDPGLLSISRRLTGTLWPLLIGAPLAFGGCEGPQVLPVQPHDVEP